MFKIIWDKETGGILLSSKVQKETLGISPRPVFCEELDLIGIDKLGWSYPHSEEPLMWAVNKQYWYRGSKLFEVKGANIYDAPLVVIADGVEPMLLDVIDVPTMLEKNSDQMFLIESEAIEFIRDTYISYAGVNRAHDNIPANSGVDFEALAIKVEKKTKTKMAVVKEDCDSFDIMPLDVAKNNGKKVLLSTRIDKFIASFSGGKDSQVVLDLCTRAIPPTDFEVIYSDTGYELPPSLHLYDETQSHYKQLFPALKFSTARNHESVLNYWDKIGSPSDTHRWCCSIMKTAPLYRALKVDGNKQARVLTFDGVRSEESVRRSNYNRSGKGKHVFTYNAHPILSWNTTEIFLYLFRQKLPMNIAYRQGMTRVGCVICPFASEWNDHIVQNKYSQEQNPFIFKLNDWISKTHVQDVASYVKTGKWQRSALGGDKIGALNRVLIGRTSQFIKITITTPSSDFFEWLKTLGSYSLHNSGKNFRGDINFSKSVYSFEGVTSKDKIEVRFSNTSDKQFINYIIRIAHKSAYCIQCEVCEVECPTGALSILPSVSIGKQCVHCLKCLTWHEKGCIVADCIRKISGNNMETTLKIKGYKNFGLREEWVDEYMVDIDGFLSGNVFGSAMYDSFKAWGKDAGILDAKNGITKLGRILHNIYQDNPLLFWEVVWINLSYSSFVVNRFNKYVKIGEIIDKPNFVNSIGLEENVSSTATLENAVQSLLDMFNHSPVGIDLMQGECVSKGKYMRSSYEDISLEAVAYSMYKYAENKDLSQLRVSDLYKQDEEFGIAREFGLTKNELLKKLRSLSSSNNRVLIAELNMGLDHINLLEDFTAETVLESMTK